MKTFEITFLHTDGDIRKHKLQAFDLNRAELRFQVNWGDDMKILKIVLAD